MTGIAAGGAAETPAAPAQRIRPESAPESPEVDFGLWPEQPSAEAGPRVRIKPPKSPRKPTVGLPLLVLLALTSAFFAWVSAEPFWLAVGHADRGTLTVTECAGRGLAARCEGTFFAKEFHVDHVQLAGAADSEYRIGDQLSARMVSDSSRLAYAGDITGLHLRWSIGFGLILVCGILITWATGALRLNGRNRLIAVAISLGGPLFLLLANLAFAW